MDNNTNNKEDLKDKENKLEPESEGAHYMGVGIALGVAFGAAIRNIGLGIALGVAFGAGIQGLKSMKK